MTSFKHNNASTFKISNFIFGENKISSTSRFTLRFTTAKIQNSLYLKVPGI